jgi:predicted nucleotidyltransferase
MTVGIGDSGRLEGDYIETVEGLFFAVKGVHHPPGFTIAYLRYEPDLEGGRTKDGKKYARHYDLQLTEDILKRKYPQYLNHIKGKSLILQSIPKDSILRTYDPRKKLREIINKPEGDLQETIVKLVQSLQEKGVSGEALGVSGSVLIDLAGLDSDVDIIVYGVEEGRKAFEGLTELMKQTDWINAYYEENVKEVVKSRWADSGLDLNRFSLIETQKILHGRVDSRDYFFRLLRMPHEVEAEENSRPLGTVRLRATITNAEGAIYAPCSYRIEDCEYLDSCELPIPSELMSFRGKFTEQAEDGDIIEARGTLEEAIIRGERSFRVVLGRKGDYLIPVNG